MTFGLMSNTLPQPSQLKRREEEVFFKGTLKWCKHITPDHTFEPEGKWSVVIYLVGPELEKFRELQGQGIKNTLKKDEDGWYCTLSRKCTFATRGRVIQRTPPEVFRMDGDTKVPVTERVGNGSTGIAKCVVWSSPKFPGKNLRWEALRIDDLKTYSYEEDTPDAGASLNKLAAQPVEPLF